MKEDKEVLYKWVKASEELPEETEKGYVFIKYFDSPHIAIFHKKYFYVSCVNNFGLDDYYKIEWLKELSPSNVDGEKYTKDQAYELATQREISTNPNGTRQDIIWRAMGIYAAQFQSERIKDNELDAIRFAEWTELQSYHIKGMDDTQRRKIYAQFKSQSLK